MDVGVKSVLVCLLVVCLACHQCLTLLFASNWDREQVDSVQHGGTSSSSFIYTGAAALARPAVGN